MGAKNARGAADGRKMKKAKIPWDKLRMVVRFTTERDAFPGEPNHFMLYILGRIVLINIETEDEVEAGKMKLYLTRFAPARAAGWTVFDVLDAENGDTAEFLALFDGGDWTEEVTESFEPFSSDLLIIDRVEVDQAYRGHGVGLLAVRTAIECFGDGCGIIGIYPFPLQFTRGREPESPDEEKSLCEARAKVAAYWERLGFQRVGATGVWALSTTFEPPFRKVLRGIRRVPR